MRITMVAFGTRGEVQPYIALGLGLQSEGHTVQIVTIGQFYEFVTSYGLTCTPIPFHSFSDNQVSSKDTVSLRVMYQTAQTFVKQTLSVIWSSCKNAEAIIFHQMSRVAVLPVIEKLGIPAYMAIIHPKHLRFVLYQWRDINHLGQPVFDLKGYMRQFLEWHLLFKPHINRWRRDVLGLPKSPWNGVDKQILERQLPLLCAFSPLVFPRLADWPDQLHITGYWFLDHPTTWQPAQELLTFLRDGPAPVCVGFGSSHRDKGIMKMAVQALHKTQQRAILITGHNRKLDLPDSAQFLCMDNVPYDWLFPQVQITVNHGGAGSTSAGLRAGIPSVTIPYVWDQPIWAHRLSDLGVATAPISLNQCTVPRLTKAIDSAISDPIMREKAALLGEKIRAECGVQQAIALIEQTSLSS